VTDSVAAGILTLSPEGRVVYMNQAAEDLLGWSLPELEGRVIHPIVHSRTSDGSPLAIQDCAIMRAGRNGDIVRGEDEVFTRQDGSQFPVGFTAAPFATDGGIDGSVVVFGDISERKAAADGMMADLEKLSWVQRLQDAMLEDRLVLYAQPIIDLQTSKVVQHELLIRMLGTECDADGAPVVVGPGEFLPVAEEYGLIIDIDRWVIDRGAEIAAAGDAVQINVSALSVADPSVPDHIQGAINRTGADPATIVFEITETTLISDEAAARAFVERLHDLGCKVALDDFGTGYGGFTYLKQLPIDGLKIDIEFVRDLRDSSASRSVVRAIVELAKGFSLQTVAEGVEDREALQLLWELGVDCAQGFYIHRPSAIEPTGHDHDAPGVPSARGRTANGSVESCLECS
jgi:PAS domain S-box-containing protein